MKILSIDTTNNQEIKIGLQIDGSKTKVKSKEYRSSKILPQIINLLKKNKLSIKDIDEIKVNPGPGSYTGIRVGVSIANALGESLEIPINGKKGLIAPKYT